MHLELFAAMPRFSCSRMLHYNASYPGLFISSTLCDFTRRGNMMEKCEGSGSHNEAGGSGAEGAGLLSTHIRMNRSQALAVLGWRTALTGAISLSAPPTP